MAIMFCDGLVFGYGQALMPIAAANLFGYTTPQWSQLVAMMGLVGALLTLAMGPAIDRMGAKRMLLLAISLLGVHALLIAQTQQLWQNTHFVRTMLSIWVMMLPIVMVSMLALAMAICKSTHSATQFAIYMSVANFGHAAGSKMYGFVAEQSDFVQSYTMLSALFATLIVALLFHRHQHRHEAPQPDSAAAVRERGRPAYTIGIGGTEAGMFWSGAMRCPKCRADMEQILFEGTQVDRCTICNGLWFDAGEMDVMRDRQTAAALDVGDAKVGRQGNAIHEYQCPRCGGSMQRTSDPRQTHIYYETCTSCSGSYLDAGELRDLSAITIGDFFKRLTAPVRR
jgi:Zn-finger nucleic acid-binding protein